MVLVVFYTLAILFGYALMFIFKKNFLRGKGYYMGWVLSVIILNSISSVLGESLFFIFEPENYSELPIWAVAIFAVFLLIPTAFLAYPLMRFYREIFHLFEKFLHSIMMLFAPNNIASQENTTPFENDSEQMSSSE